MGKKLKTLTDLSIENFKPPKDKAQEDHWDRSIGGFSVRVGAKGTKAYTVLTKLKQADGTRKNKRYTLGRYPVMTLEQARKKATKYIQLAQAGQDPQKIEEAEAREKAAEERKEKEKSQNTFAARRKQFIETGKKRGMKSTGKPWGKKTLITNKWAIKKCSELDGLLLGDITRSAIQDLIDDVEESIDSNDKEYQTGAATAHKVHEVLSSMLSWCFRRGYIDLSPCQGIEVPEKRARERVLKDNETKAIWDALEADRSTIADAMMMLILTGQRRSEIAMMAWDEIDFEKATLEIDGSRTKNDKPHLIPLAPAVVEIIERQKRPGKYVFSTNGKTPVSGFGRVKDRIAEAAGVEDWRIHDFRRTMVTGMNEMEIAPHVVEAVVNHLSGEAKRGVAGVYNKAQYIGAREHALKAWAGQIERIISGKAKVKSNTVELRASA